MSLRAWFKSLTTTEGMSSAKQPTRTHELALRRMCAAEAVNANIDLRGNVAGSSTHATAVARL
jgi:hypothetical protein